MYKQAILGSGNLARHLHKLQKRKSTFFIDEKLDKSQAIIDGVKTFCPDLAFKIYKNKINVTCGIFRKEFDFYKKKKLLEKKYKWNISHFNRLLCKKKTSYYFWGYNKNAQKFNKGIKRIQKLFKDRDSFWVLKQHLLLRCNKLEKVDTYKMWDIPKLHKYSNKKNTFVDIGAYDGDSLEDFLRSGLKIDKVIAFEPDKKNFKKLKKYAKNIPNIDQALINAAVYNYNGKIQFSFHGNQTSSVVNGSGSHVSQVKCQTLDFLLKEKNNLIIKIDAEGAEWEIIASASKMIRTKKPTLAISLYHNINDIIDIPILFEGLIKDYNFYLRAHENNGSDLYLYCIPKKQKKETEKKQKLFSIFSNRLSFQEFNRIADLNFRSSARASGFPDIFRNQAAKLVHEDIVEKLNLKNLGNKKIVEIGPGVSSLPQMMASFCRSNGIILKFIDGRNVLEQLPRATFIEHIPDQFPKSIKQYFSQCSKAGAIISYSVCQYLASFCEFKKFIECATSLLAPGGRLLVGDIPNRDMRMRFLRSKAGKNSKSFIFNNRVRHKRFLQSQSTYLDDPNLINILQIQREKGYHAWIIPQKSNLPQGNRREDLLIERL